MKIIRPLIFSFSLLVSMAVATVHAAVTGQGTIETIRNCPTALGDGQTVTIFKLSDGQWFGLGKAERRRRASFSSSNSQLSILLLAYSKGEAISVGAGYGQFDACGQSSVNFLWNHADDYLEIGPDSRL